MDHVPTAPEPRQPSKWLGLQIDTSSGVETVTPAAQGVALGSPEGRELEGRPAAADRGNTRSKPRGPKPITDEPTKRFEGKAYPRQIVELAELETRLTMEAKKVPAAQRRRITLNTFVRLGLDIVLAHADNLAGANEAELREALYRSIASNPTARSSRK